MEREKLTEAERQRLTLAGGSGFDYIPSEEIAKALRIIDAQAARVTELENWYTRAMRDVVDLNKSRGATERENARLTDQVAQLTEQVAQLTELAIAWEDDPLVPELRAENARLTEALAEVQKAHTSANSNLQLADARCARLTEQVAQLTAERNEASATLERIAQQSPLQFERLESENARLTEALAAAEESSGRWERESLRWHTVNLGLCSEVERLRAENSNVVTDAGKAVLDAMAHTPDETLRRFPDIAVCRAELARRGLK